MVKKIIIFALLAAMTIFCHFFIDQYEKSNPEMLGDNWTMHGSENGRAEIEENGLFLFSSDQKQSVSIRQDIQSFEQGSILKLSADMKCENIRPGEKPWNLARLLLVQYNSQKNRLNFLHQVASLTGTREWKSYSQYFTIGPETKKIKIIAQLSKSTGFFRLKNLHLYPVTQTKIYPWFKIGILGAWGLFAVILLGSCFFYGNNKTVLRVMLGLAFIAIIIGTTMPNDMKIRVSGQIKNHINGVTDTFSDRFEPAIAWYISKAGHFCFFLLFGLALSMLLGRKSSIPVMIHIMLLAGTTELAQFYVDDRSPLVWDFVIDGSGGLIGILLVKFFSMNRREFKDLESS